MEISPEEERSPSDCQMTGLRGKLHRVLERLRGMRSRIGRGRKHKRKERRKEKEAEKLHDIFSDSEKRPPNSTEKSLQPSCLVGEEDDAIRGGCFRFLFARRNRRQTGYEVARSKVSLERLHSPPVLEDQAEPSPNSTCYCFPERWVKRCEFEKEAGEQKARRTRGRGRDPEGVENDTQTNKVEEAENRSISSFSAEITSPDKGEDTMFLEHEACDVIIQDESTECDSPTQKADAYEVLDDCEATLCETHSPASSVDVGSEQRGRATEMLMDVQPHSGSDGADGQLTITLGSTEPELGTGNKQDNAESSEIDRRCSIRSTGEEITIIVTSKQTIKIRKLPRPNKYRITVIETFKNSETSSSDSCTSGEVATSASTSEATTSSGASREKPLSANLREADEQDVVQTNNIMTSLQDVKEIVHASTVKLHRGPTKLSLSSSISSDPRNREPWRPTPPAISNLGYCHRGGVQSILEQLDQKFPSEFQRTDWTQFLMRKRQIWYKVQCGLHLIAGEGAYGSVFRCLAKVAGTKEDAVVKFLKKWNTRGVRALREAKITEMLREKCGDFVPKFFGIVYVKENPTYVRWGLVCEDVSEKSFGLYGNTFHGACEFHIDLLIKMKEENCIIQLPIPKRDWLYILRDCAIGLAHIHKAGVVLNDLKANNILLQKRREPKYGTYWRIAFIDFGLASYGPRGKVMKKKDLDYFRKCWHIAPEIFEGCLSTPKSDVYAFGLLLKPLIQMFNLNRYEPLQGTCLREDPSLRPTAFVLATELDVLARTEPRDKPPAPPEQH